MQTDVGKRLTHVQMYGLKVPRMNSLSSIRPDRSTSRRLNMQSSYGDLTLISTTIISENNLEIQTNIKFHPSGKITIK